MLFDWTDAGEARQHIGASSSLKCLSRVVVSHDKRWASQACVALRVGRLLYILWLFRPL